MGTEKTKVKGLDVFLQIMIAIFSLGWIGLYMPIFLEEKFLNMFYGTETMLLCLTGIVFSVIVFVFSVFLYRKVTATTVRVLFTFSFVLLMIQLYNSVSTMLNAVFFRNSYEYYIYSISISTANLRLYLLDFIPMVLLLLMLCFAMTRQKHSGMFIGQVICLLLMLGCDVLVGVYVFDEYDMEFAVVCYFIATWTFHLMLALLSIWLRRRNYYRAQEECAAFGCPFLNGGFVPGMAAPMSMPAPVAAVAPMVEKPTQKEPEAFVEPAPIVTEAPKPADGIPCPVCGEICEKDAMFCGNCGATLNRKAETAPVVQQEMLKYDATPTLEPEWEEEPATSILVEPVQTEAPVAEPKERFCRNCGTLLEEGTFFCCECGTRIEE